MYGMPGSTTYQETHANANNSSIKDILDEWYQNNLLEFSDKIDENAGFCRDRTPSTNSDDINNQGGVGKIQTSYGAWVRYIGQNNGVPTYDCSNEDLYTTSKSSNGNRALTYSIGLISMDEVWYAGGYQENNNYYLRNDNSYWTMTPCYHNIGGGEAVVFALGPSGNLSYYTVSASFDVRPVINLSADITISSADGTMNNPYVIN